MLRQNPNAMQPLSTPQHPLVRPAQSYAGELLAVSAIAAGVGGISALVAGTSMVAGAAVGFGAAALGVAAYYYGDILSSRLFNRPSDMRRGMRDVLNKAYIVSGQYLEAPIGPRSQLAGSMRQQMMMAMHNSAYTLRGAIGREAQILHR